ncbi:hypothetical protein QR98_0025560 [Sarcoptes scabiei]|uniref:Uncharacterized protein n=1 Tax=Sarcoptes scabiei TaxID=52283 RepID=A0A131ZZ84_SARSC|nr:hypothetical protein QR98_0025560 [Sarcoptes scabiei]
MKTNISVKHLDDYVCFFFVVIVIGGDGDGGGCCCIFFVRSSSSASDMFSISSKLVANDDGEHLKPD